jgi:hypothetical protein
VPPTAVGTPGTVAGVIGAEGTEYGPTPADVAAATSNTYAVPLVRPVSANPAAGEDVRTGSDQVVPPSVEYCTRYSMIGVPPRSVGGAQVRSTRESPGTPTTSLGAVGEAAGVTGSVLFENAPVPAALTAATWKT